MTAADIEQFRNALGLSQTDLAARVGVTPQAVCQWEAGKRKPSRPVLILLEQMRDEARKAVSNSSNSA
jgi:DNA-binding transcriptional regulator YiaG